MKAITNKKFNLDKDNDARFNDKVLETSNIDSNEQGLLELKATLLGSLLGFTKVFYRLRTGKHFLSMTPPGRESHRITICRALTKVFRGESKRLIINIPPRYGKTELIICFIAWCLARYADCNFLYVSYAHSLARKQTHTVRDLISLPNYYKIFDTKITQDTAAKDEFETLQGGSVFATGAQGSITGRGAGIMNCNRFGGAIIIDDIHKPDEATSDTIRKGVIDWYDNTLLSRLNDPSGTPIIIIGQRVHENDLCGHLLEEEGDKWDKVILPALDSHNNPLCPQIHTRKQLLEIKEKRPYVYASQYDQNPQPPGGGIFKRDWFYLLDDEPEILVSFFTIDTAETANTSNDATVFSLFGLYKIKVNNEDMDLWGLHWMDCAQMWVEPLELEPNFSQFFSLACRPCHKVKPKLIAIEKKSTGTTFAKVLRQKYQGLEVLEIERTAKSGSKVVRFDLAAPYVANHQVTLPRYGKHTPMCIDHCCKITRNNTHRFDDIGDTLSDGVNLGLIDEIIIRKYIKPEAEKTDQIVRSIANSMNNINNLRSSII